MPRKTVNINKTNQAKLNKAIAKFTKISNKEEFYEQFNELIKSEIRSLKDCSEKNIVEYYINATTAFYDKMLEDKDSIKWQAIYFHRDIVPLVRGKLAAKYTSNQSFDNNIDIYFNEVKREYILHPMNESNNLEFLPENRDIFIKNNLKLVINCAKRYRNLGIPFEDLIQIGNEGLLTAFEKFDSDKAKLQSSIKSAIDSSELDSFTYEQAKELITGAFIYDKDLNATLSKLPENGFESKEQFKNWTTKNVKKAVFASVAFKWILAFILSELSNFSKIVKFPTSALKKEEQESELYIPSSSSNGSLIISLDSVNPNTDDCYHDNQIAEVANKEFIIEDNSIDRENSQLLLKKIINNALSHLSDFDRRIVNKKFGIGFPDTLSLNDIAESEGLPVNKIKYILNMSLKELSKYIKEADKSKLYELLS